MLMGNRPKTKEIFLCLRSIARPIFFSKEAGDHYQHLPPEFQRTFAGSMLFRFRQFRQNATLKFFKMFFYWTSKIVEIDVLAGKQHAIHVFKFLGGLVITKLLDNFFFSKSHILFFIMLTSKFREEN